MMLRKDAMLVQAADQPLSVPVVVSLLLILMLVFRLTMCADRRWRLDSCQFCTHTWKHVYSCMCITPCCCLQRDALVYNAGAEIGTGFLLIIMLFSARRAILLTFLYWNWLRMRYFSPDAATYHAMVRRP